MFYVTIWQETAESWDDPKVRKNLLELASCKLLVKEIIDILEIKYDEVDIIDKPVDLGFKCPLDLYCTYTRDQILVARDFVKPATVREGVKWLPDKDVDVFFITLNKSDKEYSPTTM